MMSSGILTENTVSKFGLMFGLDLSKFIDIQEGRNNGGYPKSSTACNHYTISPNNTSTSKASLSISKPSRTRQVSADTLEMGGGGPGKSPVKND